MGYSFSSTAEEAVPVSGASTPKIPLESPSQTAPIPAQRSRPRHASRPFPGSRVPVRIFVIGPPGSNCDEVAAHMADQLQVVNYSTRAMIAAALKRGGQPAGTALLQNYSDAIHDGRDHPGLDDAVGRVVRTTLSHAPPELSMFVLSGYPRSTRQAMHIASWPSWLRPTACIALTAPSSVLLQRSTNEVAATAAKLRADPPTTPAPMENLHTDETFYERELRIARRLATQRRVEGLLSRLITRVDASGPPEATATVAVNAVYAMIANGGRAPVAPAGGGAVRGRGAAPPKSVRVGDLHMQVAHNMWRELAAAAKDRAAGGNVAQSTVQSRLSRAGETRVSATGGARPIGATVGAMRVKRIDSFLGGGGDGDGTVPSTDATAQGGDGGGNSGRGDDQLGGRDWDATRDVQRDEMPHGGHDDDVGALIDASPTAEGGQGGAGTRWNTVVAGDPDNGGAPSADGEAAAAAAAADEAAAAADAAATLSAQRIVFAAAHDDVPDVVHERLVAIYGAALDEARAATAAVAAAGDAAPHPATAAHDAFAANAERASMPTRPMPEVGWHDDDDDGDDRAGVGGGTVLRAQTVQALHAKVTRGGVASRVPCDGDITSLVGSDGDVDAYTAFMPPLATPVRDIRHPRGDVPVDAGEMAATVAPSRGSMPAAVVGCKIGFVLWDTRHVGARGGVDVSLHGGGGVGTYDDDDDDDDAGGGDGNGYEHTIEPVGGPAGVGGGTGPRAPVYEGRDIANVMMGIW